MLHHIVWWTLKPEAEGKSAKENGDRLVQLGNAMNGKIDTLIHAEFSVKILQTSTVEAQLVLHSTHKDAEALAAYSVHPVHVAFGSELKPCVSSRQALDFEV